MQEHITGTEFSPELSASVVHGEVELSAPTSLRYIDPAPYTARAVQQGNRRTSVLPSDGSA